MLPLDRMYLNEVVVFEGLFSGFLNTEKRTKYAKENLPLKLFFVSHQLRLLRHDQIPNSHLPHLVHFLGLDLIKQEQPNYVSFDHIELLSIYIY